MHVLMLMLPSVQNSLFSHLWEEKPIVVSYTLKLYCDYFNAIGEKCNAKGIRFGYHNHDKELSTKLDGQTIYDFMLTNTDPVKVIFEMDLYWALKVVRTRLIILINILAVSCYGTLRMRAEIGASGKMDFAGIWGSARHIQECSMELLKLKNIISTSLQAAR